MKATTDTLGLPVAAEKGGMSVYMDLFKARLTFLVLFTMVVGFYLGQHGPMNWLRMFHALFGTALVASGAAALNQYLERDLDAKMRRTESRPLPAGRLTPDTVLVLGGIISAAGLLYLALLVNSLTAFLGAITLLCYLFIYTPLKLKTPLNTIIGAIPGALPPLMGWTAATPHGEMSTAGWSLFMILFFWQLPHFLAIAWIYREDYARAGFQMLPVVDPEGRRTGRSAVSHALGLLPVSLCPALFQLTGVVYFIGALLLSLAFLWYAIQFARHLGVPAARRLFYASILYLPALLLLMIFDKVK